ncbi:DNA gyrase C-terminal beta-propeller domain-containing protein, partial [Klebsiella pneumoniae]
EVSIVGRNTQGVTLIRTAEDEKVVGLQRVAETEDDDNTDEEGIDVDGEAQTDADTEE